MYLYYYYIIVATCNMLPLLPELKSNKSKKFIIKNYLYILTTVCCENPFHKTAKRENLKLKEKNLLAFLKPPYMPAKHCGT